MNTFKKVMTTTILGLAVLASSSSANAGSFSLPLPEIRTLSAQVGEYIAAEVTAQIRQMLSAPRTSRVRHSPSVQISELAAVIVVEATRLPALPESEVAVAQVTF